jgi:hypothetical protein
MKIRPVVAELFHADGQTDKTKKIAAFRNSANAPKMTVIGEPASSMSLTTKANFTPTKN